MGEVRSQKDQVSRPIITNTVADHALAIAVGDQREFKFRMVVPIECEFPITSFISAKGAIRQRHFFKPGEHTRNLTAINFICAINIQIRSTQYIFWPNHTNAEAAFATRTLPLISVNLIHKFVNESEDGYGWSGIWSWWAPFPGEARIRPGTCSVVMPAIPD